MERCFNGSILLQNYPGAGVPAEAVVCWVRLGAHWELAAEKPPVLQEWGAGESMGVL